MRFKKGDGVFIVGAYGRTGSGRTGVVVDENQSVFYQEKRVVLVEVAGYNNPLTYYDNELIHSNSYYLDKFNDEVQRRG